MMNKFRNYRYLASSILGILSLVATLGSSGPWRPAQAAQAASDVSVSMVADKSMVKAGQKVSYTVTMSNTGPDDATFVDVALAIPDGMQIVSMTCDQGISPDGPFCEYSSLPSGVSLVSTLVVTPQAGSAIRMRIVTTSASILFENADAFDPDTANNAVAVKTRVIGPLSKP